MVSLEEIFTCKTQEWKLLLESCGESREWTSINYFLLSSLAWPVRLRAQFEKAGCDSAAQLWFLSCHDPSVVNSDKYEFIAFFLYS